MVPPPAYTDTYNEHKLNLTVNDEVFPRVIPDIAKKLGLNKENVINLYNSLGGKNRSEYQLFCDGQSCDKLHPNHVGYSIAASAIFNSLFGPTMKVR